MVDRSTVRRSFSLVEVVIAVGVFAAAIVAIIGLLGPTLRTTREVLDSTVAARLAEGVEGELKRVTFNTVWSVTGGGTLEVYATADGSRVIYSVNADNAATDSPPGIPVERRYFRLLVSRLAAPLPTAAGGFLPLEIRVEWPYRLPDGSEAAASQRSSFSFNTALLR